MLAHRPFRRPSPAMAVALVALFVALGGSSYAAITLNKNSVKSKHIGNGQVKRADIQNDAINSSKVEFLSLRASDFKPGQLPEGPQGPQGAGKGDAGATNVKGAPRRDSTGSPRIVSRASAPQAAAPTAWAVSSWARVLPNQPLAFSAPARNSQSRAVTRRLLGRAAVEGGHRRGGPADVTAWVVCARAVKAAELKSRRRQGRSGRRPSGGEGPRLP